jgi:hypothetical protein
LNNNKYLQIKMMIKPNWFSDKSPGTVDRTIVRTDLLRSLGYDYEHQMGEKFKESITDPNKYITERENARKMAYTEAADNFSIVLDKLYSNGFPESIAYEKALGIAKMDLSARMAIVENLYPTNLNRVASDSLFTSSIANTPGRLQSSQIKRAQGSAKKAGKKRGRKAKK